MRQWPIRLRWRWIAVLVLVTVVAAGTTWAYVHRDRSVRWESASRDGYGPAIIWPHGVPRLKGDDTGAWDAVLHWDAVYMAAYNDKNLRIPQLESITTPEFLDDLDGWMSRDGYFPGPSPLIPESVEPGSDGTTLVHACGSIEGPFATEESVREDLTRHGAAPWTFILVPNDDHDGWLVAWAGWNADDGYCSVADAQIGLFDPAPDLPTLRQKYGDDVVDEFYGITPTPEPS